MARTKTQKKEIVEKLTTIMNGAKTLVFVNIHGLKVADATALRRALTAEKVGFFVAKKTLTSIALASKKYEGTAPALNGELGISYGVDLIAPARGIYEFQKKSKDTINILGGVFENRYMTRDEMTAIASTPPLNVLHGMFVNIINSPIQGLVVALDQMSKKQSV